MPDFSAPLNGVSLSDALKEAAVHAPSDRVVLATYEFVHSSFTTRALVVVDHTDLEAKTETGDLVTYVAIAGLRPESFEESDQASTPLLKLTLDGVSGELIDKLDAALLGFDPVTLIERIYVSDDLDSPAILPPATAIIRSGSVSETSVTIEAGFGDPANQPFPRKLYTRGEYPGLAAQ
jgi:hypothetical protein